ncbi:MAG: hypothetical protein LQ347_003918 [Umbilicaria vellea]|nr:MAG: hypothetical protein LQ347_003918 [Umbilicaria vellea]
MSSVKSPTTSSSDDSQNETEGSRGRRQDRRSTTVGKTGEGSGGEQAEGPETPQNGKPRKRKRSRKGLDKKFDCPHKGCGKSYSRAEHLYRHQLNHNPKEIYKCDHHDCPRSFVRQDLCARHRERHTNRGSHLQRNHSYIHSIDAAPLRSPSVTSSIDRPLDMPRPASAHGANLAQDHRITSAPYVPPLSIPPLSIPSPLHGTAPDLNHVRSSTRTPPGNHLSSPRTYSTPANSTYGAGSHVNRPNSDGQYYTDSSARIYDSSSAVRNLPIATYDTTQRHTNFMPSNPAHYQKPLDMSPHHARSSGDTSTSPADFRPTHSSASNSRLCKLYPPPIFPMTPQALPRSSEISYSPATRCGQASADSASDMEMSASGAADFNPTDPMAASYAMPVFGAEGYNVSPSIQPDDLMTWLFNNETPANAVSPGGKQRGSMSNGPSSFLDNAGNMSALAYSMGGSSIGGQYANAIPQQPPIMAVTSILDPGLPQMILSEEKRQQLLEVIGGRFNETDHAPVRKQKEALFRGDQEQESHVLSLRMLQTYIGSYWYHFHTQMPILHKSTFSADRAQNLLLIAVIAIGASCLDKIHGPIITKAGAELSCFLAWHLRGEIFMDADFRPPAKLWVFQTLILLEIYEKMYSTRVLHERAHIHHATTLTLMRRGSSLLGKSALDSPPSLKEEKPGPATNGVHRAVFAFSSDQWWNHWITSEATRRVAFAAFIMDALHATMFGHGAIMNANEMRLTLPVDEALWSATSGGEVNKLEANLSASGIRPTPFLEALKRTLSGENVRTNSFGRTALMAGLLSLTWHLTQRDQQVTSLGVSRLGGKDIWRGPLTKAIDFWKRDFDESIANEGATTSTPSYSRSGKLDEENIFESRTVLHHLAHMAKHVDVVQLQIFAKAGRLLGRTITPQDYVNAQKRIKERWARSAAARDATFYALKFLCQVLLPDADNPQHGPSAARSAGFSGYSARDDFLLNRPWVLYFAALTVWSYGFALDGPMRSPPVFRTFEDQSNDMRMFLQRVGGVELPDGLMDMHDRNACMGMLLILHDMFRRCRWELLHEAASLLSNCIELLKGTI